MGDPRDPDELTPEQEPQDAPQPEAAQPEDGPAPGTTEWLLAQLSGGRITSRRERREVEAALAEAQDAPRSDAVPDLSPVDSAPEAPRVDAAQPNGDLDSAGSADESERPKGRFSWETGLVEQISDTPLPQADAAASAPADAPRSSWEAIVAPAEEAAPESAPFLWHLGATDAADPLLNTPSETDAAPAAPAEPEFHSAAPLIVPQLPADEPAAPAEPAPAVRPEPSAQPTAPPAPADASVQPANGDPDTPAAPAAFDPFEQDLFNPHPEIVTPVPSVAEFTMPDEAEAEAAPAEDPAPGDAAHEGSERRITSDWSDIAAMLGTPVPQTGALEIEPVIAALPQPADEPSSVGDPAAATAAEELGTEAMPLAEPRPVEELPTQALVPARPAVAPAPLPGSFDEALALATAPQPGGGEIVPVGAPPTEHGRSGGPNRWLLIVAIVLVAVLLAIGLYALGRAIAARGENAAAGTTNSQAPQGSPSTSPSQTPSDTPSQTPSEPAAPSVPPTGILPVGGPYQWDQLRGGECIDPFTSVWAQTFSVVDCGQSHLAQLVYTASYASDPAAAFPGEAQIAGQINLLCSKPGIVDLNKAAAFDDVQLVGSYPVTAEQWAAGQRNYYCFVTRSSGQPLNTSVAGPGPTA